MITNVSTTYVHTTEGDHKLLMSEVIFKLKAHDTTIRPSILHFRTPTTRTSRCQMTRSDILRALQTYSTTLKLLFWNKRNYQEKLRSFAEETSRTEKILHTHIYIYIPIRIWTLLECKCEAAENGDDDMANQLSQEVIT